MLRVETSQMENEWDLKKPVFHQAILHRVLVSCMRVILRAVIYVKVEGMENVPIEGPVILAANRLTNFDILHLQMVMDRSFFFMTKAEVHHNRLVDIVLHNLGAFPVNQETRDPRAINYADRLLKNGHALVFFPEGTRRKGQGLRAGKTSAARLALANNCPIIPLALDCSQQNMIFPRGGVIHIIFGEVIYPEEQESALALTDQIMFTIADMLPIELRGVYTKRPQGFEFGGND